MINIFDELELTRKTVNGRTLRKDRSVIGQFFTPAPIACFMASLFQKNQRQVRILDPGAGTGVLFTALVKELAERTPKPEKIEVVACEADESLRSHLEKAINLCGQICQQHTIQFSGEIVTENFISLAVAETDHKLFHQQAALFTHAILNPPYKKIHGDSTIRRELNGAGIETSNLYSAFVWLSARMLETGGELVAITPRSFCNGPYFRPFRKALIDLVGFQRIHLFQSRKLAFREDSVLQENIIYHGVRGLSQPARLMISASNGNGFSDIEKRTIPFDSVVLPGDADAFIHLAEDDKAREVMEAKSRFHTTLEELELEVSTGRVVDFRARDYLRSNPETDTVPLLYPCHFAEGFTRWPLMNSKKPNAIVATPATMELLTVSGYYVLTKRFSSKEQNRRVSAAVCDPNRFQAAWFAFENHLNYFHASGKGLLPDLAKGLALYLNTTLFDQQFRLFSGHTQVNATDLRKMRYPTRRQLIWMGEQISEIMPAQSITDEILERVCTINNWQSFTEF